MSDDDELSPGQIKEITAYVDIEARPPDDEPTALILFGTNQAAPAVIAAGRYHRGLAPLLIATGGINRHNGIVEGREFARLLTAADVPGTAIRVEDQSADTWQNRPGHQRTHQRAGLPGRGRAAGGPARRREDRPQGRAPRRDRQGRHAPHAAARVHYRQFRAVAQIRRYGPDQP